MKREVLFLPALLLGLRFLLRAAIGLRLGLRLRLRLGLGLRVLQEVLDDLLVFMRSDERLMLGRFADPLLFRFLGFFESQVAFSQLYIAATNPCVQIPTCFTFAHDRTFLSADSNTKHKL